MKKIRKISLLFTKISIITVMLLTVSTVVYAVEDYTTLAPLPGTTECGQGTTPNSGTGGCKTNFQTYLPGIFKFAIGLAAGMAFVMITFGGFLYATTDAISGKSQGREYIENALWGLGLVLGAWIILYTINPQILQFDLNLKKPQITYGSVSIVPGVAMTEANLASDQQVRDRLSSSGISTNAPPCRNGETRGCTNLNGLADSTVSGVTGLRQACGTQCQIIVTGGTEPGHTAGSCHTNGTCVDIASNTNINNFLSPGQAPHGNANGQTPTQKTIGNCTYTYENVGDNGAATGAHWHAVCR